MLDFGIPKNTRIFKEEKYLFPVLTINARPDDATKIAYSFTLNTAAIEKLKIVKNNYVAFNFEETNDKTKIIIANVTERNLSASVTSKVTLRGMFSSKEYHTYICDKMGLKQSVDNEFKLMVETMEDGQTIEYFALASIEESDVKNMIDNFQINIVKDETVIDNHAVDNVDSTISIDDLIPQQSTIIEGEMNFTSGDATIE